MTNLKHWRSKNPESKIPRSIGKRQFRVEGETEMRIIVPYSLWIFKRTIELYRSLPIDARSDADALPRPLGFGDSLELGLANRLICKANRLGFE